MFKTYNLLNIGFPIYLIIFEILIRNISSVDTSLFVGPALAASGLGLIIGIIKPKKVIIDAATEQLLTNNGLSAIVRDKKDEKVVIIGWIGILVGLLMWYWCCAITIKNGVNNHETKYYPLFIGILSYALAVILSSFKESE